MLSRAVVLQRALFARWDRATQHRRIDVGPPENLEGFTGFVFAAVMGSASNRHRPIAATLGIEGTTGDKRLGLKRLQRRADKTQMLGIASTHKQATARITNHGMDPMHRFAHAIAQQSHLQRGVPREAGTTKTHR